MRFICCWLGTKYLSPDLANSTMKPQQQQQQQSPRMNLCPKKAGKTHPNFVTTTTTTTTSFIISSPSLNNALTSSSRHPSRWKKTPLSLSQSMAYNTKEEEEEKLKLIYRIVNIRTWLRGWSGAAADADAGDGDDEENYYNQNGGEDNQDTNGMKSKRRSIIPLVDLRSIVEYNERHLEPKSTFAAPAAPTTTTSTTFSSNRNEEDSDGGGIITIVNLPLATLLSGERSCELPPRNLNFAILIPREYATTFLDESQRGGGGAGAVTGNQCTIHKLFFASHSKATMQSRKPWRVRQVLIDTDALWNEAETIEEKLVVRFGSSSISRVDRIETPFQCLPRLWKPDPLISSYVLSFLKEWAINYCDDNITDFDATSEADSRHQPKKLGLVWDLGCGSGRDVCYLAEELKEFRERNSDNSSRPVHFVGVDNHKGSAARCTPLWKNRGVDDVTQSICLDLNKLHLVRDCLMDPARVLQLPLSVASHPPDVVCIYSIRFLNRKLLSAIANSRTVDKQQSFGTSNSPLVIPLGTVVAISHFCKPQEGACWNFDHPKVSSVLDRWELRNLFVIAPSVVGEGEDVNECNDKRWQILKDELIVDGDHGRTLIQFVAKKVA